MAVLTAKPNDDQEYPIADFVAITKEETVILPSTQNPIQLLSVIEKEQTLHPVMSLLQWSNLKSQQNIIALKKPNNKKQKSQRPKSDEQRFGYKKLLHVLEDELNKQAKEEQFPKIIIAQGVIPPPQQNSSTQQQLLNPQSKDTSTHYRQRRSEIDTGRKPKKEPSVIAQRFLIQRQIRNKKKNAKKKIRRKSCACSNCGSNTLYEQKNSDLVIPTVMTRKLNLANFLINNLKSEKSLVQRREKQMQLITTALERTFHDEMELDSKNSFKSSYSKLDSNIPSPSKSRTFLLDVSPLSPPVPQSNRMTTSMEPISRASRTFTKLDLENYKFNRNKQNYSRANQNIKIMRNTLFSTDVLKSLTTMNMIDEHSVGKKVQQLTLAIPQTNSQKHLSVDGRRSRVCPYEVHERSQQGNTHQKMPPKIIPRRDLQNMLYKRFPAAENSQISQTMSTSALTVSQTESSREINMNLSQRFSKQQQPSPSRKGTITTANVSAIASLPSPPQIEMAHVAFAQQVEQSLLKQNHNRQLLSSRNSNSMNELRQSTTKLRSCQMNSSNNQGIQKFITCNTARTHYGINLINKNSNNKQQTLEQQQHQNEHSIFQFQKEQLKPIWPLTAANFFSQKANQASSQQQQQQIQQSSNKNNNSLSKSMNILPLIESHRTSFRN